ncbi:type V CRISPR-associated protein Cas12k [Cyanobacterium sp. HL-69]|uniref:type V CRISPR-associated protein Cas12k n=1 Tax=Cyanobacterium sp. HL-69 TaxID=2054282 RepID=UPI00406BBD70
MSLITIQCRLVASADTRQFLWMLMSQKNTPLINEIFMRIAEHPDFSVWKEKGKLPKNFLAQQIAELKEDKRFQGQPSRFYASVHKMIDYVYESWFTIQDKNKFRLQGHTRWLEMLKPDTEILQCFDGSWEKLQNQAKKILDEIDSTLSHTRIVDKLFKEYEATNDPRIQGAIVYLIKNGASIPDNKVETEKKYKKLKRKVEIQVHKLKKQIEISAPTGRDLNQQKWLDTLILASLASTTMPLNQAQCDRWFSALKKNSPSIPYPVIYETNEDLKWSLSDQNRLHVRFNGLSDHTFKIYCDSRQLPYFQRFYEDQELKKANKNQFSSALFTLRSAMIIWKEDDGKGELWDKHKLYLHCTLDTDYWTVEGTQVVAQRKQKEVLNIIDGMKEKDDLRDTQKKFIQRKETTLARLNNIFPRPGKPIYQGNPNLFLGVAMGLQESVTLALVNVGEGKAILYRNIKQLLGDNYHLLRRRRNEKQKLNHQNHKARKRASFQQKGESNLGEYVDRLIAKSILKIAQEYKVSTIIIPLLSQMRSITEAEVQARAEERIPEYKEGQKKYAKDYRVQVHQWSYGRLIDNIKANSAKVGIVVREGKQPKQGTFTDKALQLALSIQQNITEGKIPRNTKF